MGIIKIINTKGRFFKIGSADLPLPIGSYTLKLLK
jgi:hypothetical protein